MAEGRPTMDDILASLSADYNRSVQYANELASLLSFATTVAEEWGPIGTRSEGRTKRVSSISFVQGVDGDCAIALHLSVPQSEGDPAGYGNVIRHVSEVLGVKPEVHMQVVNDGVRVPIQNLLFVSLRYGQLLLTFDHWFNSGCAECGQFRLDHTYFDFNHPYRSYDGKEEKPSE